MKAEESVSPACVALLALSNNVVEDSWSGGG